jgi:hypothetical protein
MLRTRVEITGSSKHGNVGESQPVLIMNDPVISTHTRSRREPTCLRCATTRPLLVRRPGRKQLPLLGLPNTAPPGVHQA